MAGASDVVKRYFEAFARRDAAAMGELWAPDGIDRVVGQQELRGPDEVRAFFAALFGAFGDLETTVESMVVQRDRVAVHWKAAGTMTGPLRGVEATGARVEFEGFDMLRVTGGQIVANSGLADGLSIVRQIGMLPPADSTAERQMINAVNARTRATRRVAAGRDLERVADGVWLLRGGVPRYMNVYLLEDEGGGVTLFGAGIKAMTAALAAAAAPLGGINRVVLSHADADHRGAAARLGAPVVCHPADRSAAESSSELRDYWRLDRLRIPARWLYPTLFRYWDGGPVQIAETVEEGADVSGFRVVHLPGNAPGLIGLFRESDRLALVSDCVYMIDVEMGRPVPPRVSHPAFTWDEAQARASIRRLAELDPSAVWPGHSGPLSEDVRAALERAAAGS
jgi:steroid delta-isomerase-like uncharacterized protein